MFAYIMPHQLATTWVTDGTKSIPLDALRPDAWMPVDDYQYGARSFSTRIAQTVVPILYRAIDIRCKAISRLPLRLEQNGNDVTEAQAPMVARLRALLSLTEAALCLTNQAYWELTTNRAGRNLTPEWLAVGTVSPNINRMAQTRDAAILGYNRTDGKPGTLTPDKVIPFWAASAAVEIGPDPTLAPAAVVLSAAGLLHDLDRYAQGFFQRGGIKMTLLTVEGSPPKEEKDRLKTWWDQMTRGVRKAFESVVISAAVKPQVIGSSPNETAAPQLTKISREDVAAGMGVPMALLMISAPLAGGTADAERLNFYDFTVVPEAEWIGGVVNDRYLSKLGMRLIFEPEKLEVYQWSEVQKANSIAALVPGQQVLTIDEARALIGYEPKAIEQAPAPIEAQPVDVPPTAAQAEMVKWQRKARERLKDGKSLDFPFRPDAIPVARADAIKARLMTATDLAAIEAAFL